MARILAGALLLALNLSSPAAAQERVTERELRALMNEQRQAVTLYRDGRLDDALAIVRARSASMNHRIAERIIQWLEDPAPQLRDPKQQLVQHWNPALAAALASLHMEMALLVYTGGGTLDTYRLHLRTARLLFDQAAKRGHPVGDQLARWILAIGATAQADGQFWWAAEILADGCEAHPDYVDLLVACGSVQESIAVLPAHLLLAEGRQRGDEDAVRFGVDTQQQAVAARNRRLSVARRMLEHAVTLRPNDVEARLRLARVFALTGNDSRAVPLLEAIVPAAGQSERRSAFLARLLLGTSRLRQGLAADAVRLFEECVRLVPSAPSGYAALAHALHRSGKVDDAAAVTERMFKAPSHPPDPWGSYRYGQYWIAEPLLDSLRTEVRR